MPLSDRRFQRPDVIDLRLAREPLECRLAEPIFNVAGNAGKSPLGFVVVGGRDVNDNLNVGSEAGKGLLAHVG